MPTLGDLIRALSIFQGVPNTLLSGIVPDMEIVLLDGDYLVRQGETPRFLCVVLDGSVDISVRLPSGSRILIGSRSAGDVVGEQAFVEQKTHSADVRAHGDIRCLQLPAELVQRLLLDPRFARNLLTVLSAKLREATSQRFKIIAERELLFSHFRSHVNPAVVSALLTKGENYGKPRIIENGIVMFSDLRDFTRLSAAMTELEIADELGPYFSTMVENIHNSNGIVDKYIGDAVMAVWGHPALGIVNPDHVFTACLTMVREIGALRYGGEPIRIGIGLNAGTMFMGNVGSEDKRSFTVLGNAVNLAARYENANKVAGREPYAVTVGPEMVKLLNTENRALLAERTDIFIKGAPDDTQTVYSF